MTKITQAQLIQSLNQMKEIKPRKEWAVLLKSQILAEKQVETKTIKQPVKTVGIMDTLRSVFFQKKLAYAFAAFAFVVAGIFGISKYEIPSVVQPQASLTGQSVLKNDVAVLNNKINTLAQVTKEGKKDSIPSAISQITANASELAKTLKSNPVKDQATLKSIATSLKTLADVPGTDLSANQGVKDLYQTVVQSQIEDLQKSTLTDDQKKTLTDVEELYSQGKYMDALEEILLINQ